MEHSFTAKVAEMVPARLAIFAVFGLLFLRIVGIVIYRLYFHPLSKYPGPWLARVSDFYLVIHNITGSLHLETERGHKIYGNVFRQAPNKLVTNTQYDMQEIYHSKDVAKVHGYETMVPSPGAFNIFTATNKEIHRLKRKILSPGFSDRRVRSFEPVILQHVDIFIKNLLQGTEKGATTTGEWSETRNMTECCRHLLYDIMGEFGFGQSFRMQTSCENHFLIKAAEATIRKAGVYILYPGLQKLRLELVFFIAGMRMRKKYLDLMSKMVSSRIAEGQHAKADLFAYLADAKDPETGIGFTNDELWAESRFLLIAGADTSSTGLTALFFYLTTNPECWQKLADEIRSTFTTPSEIRSGPVLSGCKYLRACINEALRMSPPISSTLWREIMTDEYVINGDQVLPKGVEIGVSTYSYHHNEDIFPDSYRYNPERWLLPHEDSSSEKADDPRQKFAVFSLGTRSCPGQTMAYTEISDTIARTVWFLDAEIAESAEAQPGNLPYGRHRRQEFQLRDHLTCCHEGPNLRFRVRAGAEEEAQRLAAGTSISPDN